MKHLNFTCISLLFASFACSVSSYAQQDGQYSQYLDGGLSYNPAYAGSTRVLSITALHREQWMGMKGNPRQSLLTLHTPLPYESLGVGLTINNHGVGPIRDTYISGDVSYSLQLDQESTISFGLKAGLDLLSYDRESLTTTSGNAFISKDARSGLNPNIGLGVLWQGENFLFGISIPRLLKQDYYKDKISSENVQQQHYYITAAYPIQINREWEVRPSAHLKLTVGSPLSLDVSATAVYNKLFWIGAFYRSGSALGVLAQVQIVEALRAGVASDFALNRVKQATIEVMLNYDIDVFHVSRQITARRF